MPNHSNVSANQATTETLAAASTAIKVARHAGTVSQAGASAVMPSRNCRKAVASAGSPKLGKMVKKFADW